MSDRRKRRMEKNVKRVLSDIIRHDLEVSGADLLSVTNVEMTPDLQQATVFVSHIEDREEKTEAIMKRLRRQEKTIKSSLANELPLKHIPDLRFREDESIKRAAELNEIMQDLKKERESRNRGRES
ncbi:MAG: 30S ribosome-binding factor RbfA [bacterium]